MYDEVTVPQTVEGPVGWSLRRGGSWISRNQPKPRGNPSRQRGGTWPAVTESSRLTTSDFVETHGLSRRSSKGTAHRHTLQHICELSVCKALKLQNQHCCDVALLLSAIVHVFGPVSVFLSFKTPVRLLTNERLTTLVLDLKKAVRENTGGKLAPLSLELHVVVVLLNGVRHMTQQMLQDIVSPADCSTRKSQSSPVHTVFTEPCSTGVTLFNDTHRHVLTSLSAVKGWIILKF